MPLPRAPSEVPPGLFQDCMRGALLLFGVHRFHEDQYLKKVFRVDREFAGGEAHFGKVGHCVFAYKEDCLLYTSPSPRDS